MKIYIFFFFFFICLLKSEDLSENNLLISSFDYEMNLKKTIPDKLQSIDKTILIYDSICPGDSIFIDLADFLSNNQTILNISSNYIKNQNQSFFIKKTESGIAKINGKDFIYHLNTSFPLDTLYLLVNFKKDTNYISTIELIIPVYHKNFECRFDGNFICNGNFENFYFTTGLDLFILYQSCSNDGSFHWFGSSSDLYGKNIKYKPSFNEKVYGDNYLINFSKLVYSSDYKNIKQIQHKDYNPDTYDNDLNNQIYMGIKAIGIKDSLNKGKSDLSEESIYQNLILPLVTNKKYILEYKVFINEFSKGINIYPEIEDLKIYGYSFLSEYDPCFWSNDKQRELLTKTEGKVQIDKTYLEFGKWIHVKSQVFSVNKPMTWFWLGFALDSTMNQYNDLYYSMYFDDIIIREAGVGVTSNVDNYFPCLGDVIEYKFKIWKDDPNDNSVVEVHDILPEGLEYISGSFVKDSDGILKTVIKGAEFDSSGVSWISMVLLLPNDEKLHGKEFTNEIYFPDMPEEYRSSVGKYKITIHAARNLIDIKQNIVTTKCKGDTAEVTVKITNTSNETIEDLTVKLRNIQGLDIIWEKTQILDTLHNQWNNILKPKLYIDNSSIIFYGYLYGQYSLNDENDIVLNSIVIPPANSVLIKYYGIISKNKDELILETIAQPQQQACLISKTDTVALFPFSFNNEIFPPDTIACNELTLYSPYPELLNTWSDGSSNTELVITETGKYCLEVTDKNGCNLNDSIFVIIKNEFNLVILNPNSLICKGDSITIPVVFYYNDPLDNIKHINLEFEIDENIIEILDGDYTYTKIGMNGNKSVFNIFTDRTVPINYENKNIRIDLNFQIKNTDPDNDEIEISSVILNECQYLKKTFEINLILDNSDIIRVSGSNGSNDYFNIYPMPFDEEIVLKFNINILSDVTIQINDLLGRTEKELTLKYLKKGLYEYPLNTESLTSGLYNICLVINGEIVCKKGLKIK